MVLPFSWWNQRFEKMEELEPVVRTVGSIDGESSKEEEIN